MFRLTFKLKEAFNPKTIKRQISPLDIGIQLTYSIRKTYFFNVFGYTIPYYYKRLGKKTFVRPFKINWDKRKYRLPYVYWGKKSSPLTRHWIVLNDIYSKNNRYFIIPEVSLTTQRVKLFNYTLTSKVITDNLFKQNRKFSVNI